MLGEVYRAKGRGVSFKQGHKFGAEKWEKIVKAKGDFSVIGIHLDRDNPVGGFGEYKKIPRNGVQMRADRSHPVAD